MGAQLLCCRQQQWRQQWQQWQQHRQQQQQHTLNLYIYLNEVKNACQKQSCWLVASLFLQWSVSLHCPLRERILLSITRSNKNDDFIFYVILQWASNDDFIFYIALQGSKQIQQKFKYSTRCEFELQRCDDHTTSKIVCCIARSNNIDTFSVVSWGQATRLHCDKHTVNREKQQQRWVCFLCCITMSEQQGQQFLHCIARKWAMTEICTYCKGKSVHPEDKS